MADREPPHIGQYLRQSTAQRGEEAARVGRRRRPARRPGRRLVAGTPRATRAKYFFPEPADTSERALFARIEKWDGPRRLDQFTPELLRELTERAGCDFASALLHRRIVESDQHGPFLRALAKQADPKGLDGTVAIVPGAFYRENPRTGADGRVVQEVAAQVGLPFVVTPVASTGSLEENARLL